MRNAPGCRHWTAAGLLLGLTLVVGCTTASDAVGKWREVGRTATLVMQADGRFEAVDNQGVTLSGTYTLAPDGRARFTIMEEGRVVEVVPLQLSLQGDELTILSEGGAEPEHYRRTP